MANEKFSEFTAGNPEILVGLEAGDNVQMTVGANKILITDTNGKLYTRLNYKLYKAIFTDSNPTPSVTILENDLGAVTWASDGAGTITVTATGLLTSGKTLVKLSANYGTPAPEEPYSFIYSIGVNQFTIRTVDLQNTPPSTTSGLTDAGIEIEVYY